MSSIASKCAFSTSEKLFSDHRNSLKSKIIEALICAQNWLQHIDNVGDSNEGIEEEEEYDL